MMRLARHCLMMGGAAFLLITPATACELQPADANAPVTQCEIAGQRCKLAPGKLGVCTAQPDQQLVCASQH